MIDRYTWKLGFETAEVEGSRSGTDRRNTENRRSVGTRGIFSNRMVEKRLMETRRVSGERRELTHLNKVEAAIETAGPFITGLILLFLGLGALVLGNKFIPVSGFLLVCFFIACSIFCFYSFFRPGTDR